jgi:sulfur-oxidizing protein SoxZ
MGDPMRIRATIQGSNTEIKILVRHDMESGQRKDLDGKLVPAHFIKSLIVKWNDKIVLDANLGPAISKDPFFSFKFNGGAKGDKISVKWIDSKDDQRNDEITIS